MVLQIQKTGSVWKTPFCKSGHIYNYLHIRIMKIHHMKQNYTVPLKMLEHPFPT